MNTLFCTYIYPKYKQMVITYVDKEDDDTMPTEAEKEIVYRRWCRNLLNRMRIHYDEYKLLIDTLANEKTHLMDAVKSQTKYNDTPQTVTAAGVVSYDDTYNTNVSTNYSDGATKIARIAEIEALLKDYYTLWRDEVCGGLFMYEE